MFGVRIKKEMVELSQRNFGNHENFWLKFRFKFSKLLTLLVNNVKLDAFGFRKTFTAFDCTRIKHLIFTKSNSLRPASVFHFPQLSNNDEIVSSLFNPSQWKMKFANELNFINQLKIKYFL